MNLRQFYAEVGSRIRRAWKTCSLTQESHASRVSLTWTSITNIEQDRTAVNLFGSAAGVPGGQRRFITSAGNLSRATRIFCDNRQDSRLPDESL